jgi:hypothetical protein
MFVNQKAEFEEEEIQAENDNHDPIIQQGVKTYNTSSFGKDITALTLQLRKLNKNMDKKGVTQKYKWRYTPPKEGESATKHVRENGTKKTYHIGVNTINNGRDINLQSAKS